MIGNDIMGLMIGVAVIMYGVSKIITVLRVNKMFSRKRDAVEQNYSQPEKPQEGKWQKFDDSSIKDVDFEKVD